MTVEAIWSDLEPGTVLPKNLHEEVLATRPDVEAFIERLSQPDTSEAQLIHSARPLEIDSTTGRTVPDHQVVVAVCDGFGYVEFSDDDHFCQSVGSPESPGWTTTTSNDFHPRHRGAVGDLGRVDRGVPRDRRSSDVRPVAGRVGRVVWP